MKSAFAHTMKGLDEVEAYLSGKREGFRAHVPSDVDVKRIRQRLRMTQARFAEMFGFSLDAVKHWEARRRTPEASARVLLTVISQDPTAVLAALHPKTLRPAARNGRTANSKSKHLLKPSRRAGTSAGLRKTA